MPHPGRIDRGQVLSVAIAVLEQEGYEALTMRALATRLEVRASSLYHYFPDKSSLEMAIMEYGNAEMLTRLERAARGRPPADAFARTAKAYLAFARTRPALYLLMMEHRTSFPPRTETGKSLWNFVLGVIAPISGDPEDTPKAVAYWSFLHGFAALEHAARFGSSGAQSGFQVGIQSLLRGFQA